MANNVVKDYQKLDLVFNRGIKDLKEMLEPDSDIAVFSRIAYNGLPWYFFKRRVLYHRRTRYYQDYGNDLTCFYCTVVTFLTMSME